MLYKNWKEEKIFAITMLFVGVILIFILPPMSSPDERTHFINAYTISYGDVFPENVEGKSGKYIDSTVIDFVNNYYEKYTGKLDEKYSFRESYFSSFEVKKESNLTFFTIGNLMNINPIGYMIAALGMVIGRGILYIIGHGVFNNPYNMLMFAKMANLLFYVLIGMLAIHRTPRFKKIMTVLLLFPMNLYIASTVSYDAVLIPIVYLFFSEIMLLLEEDKVIQKIDILIVCLSAFFMFGIKPVYVPVLLLLLLVPKSRYENKKMFLVCFISFCSLAFISFCIPRFLLYLRLDGISETYIEIEKQYEYVISHWWLIPSIILNSFKKYQIFYLESFYGKFGELDVNLPIPFLGIGMFAFGVLVLLSLLEEKSVKIVIKFYIAILLIISITAMFMALYITWSSLIEGIGENSVTGVQGRYFLPLAMFVPIIFTHEKLGKIGEKFRCINTINRGIMEFLCIVNPIITVIVCYMRYYS